VLIAALRYLAEARDRSTRAVKGRRLATNGTIVIFDRYPLRSVKLEGRTMDGPRIQTLPSDTHDKLLDPLRRREKRIYEHLPVPDLVVLLQVSPEVALARKASQRPEAIAGKARAVLEASGAGENVVAIDASRPLQEVVRAVKNEVWRRV
jgi:thymidylate kinase